MLHGTIRLGTALVLLACAGVPVAMGEMANRHWRGNFHRKPMFVPVFFPPLFVAAGFLFLGFRAPWAAWAFGAAAVLLVLMGLAGAFFHVQGVARQTGGWNLDNVMVGPPTTAPLAFAFLGILGLAGVLWWEA